MHEMKLPKLQMLAIKTDKIHPRSKKTLAWLCVSATLSTAPLFLVGLPVKALPNGGQIVQYLNPIHEKSYLNEKQDRLIKKKSFKSVAVTGLTAIANKDIGLFAILPVDKWQETNYIEHLLINPEISGLSILIPWAVLEPAEQSFDWKTIDEILSLCGKRHKQLILRVSTCGVDLPKGEEGKTFSSDTPTWVFEAGAKSITYTGKDGKQHLMPIFWDGTYLAKWFNFVNELGKHCDKNPNIQSIGITGGGVLGGTKIIPELNNEKNAYADLEKKLKDTYGMNPRQLVNHWKYVADVFPKAFQKQHLNFELAPPTANRKGQDCLDEIADYLLYRYGQRVYVTRQNVKDQKRGFDDYRLMIKYKDDTLQGYQFTSDIASEPMKPLLPKVSKNVFDDACSFAEIPSSIFDSNDTAIKQWLTQMRLHLGYQLVLQELSLPATIAAGKSLPVNFVFLNTGDTSPKRQSREIDKGVPSSYKIQLEFKDAQGKMKALLRHTPTIPTTNWLGTKPITWDQELKAPPLKPGKYQMYLAIIDDQNNQKINYCDALPEHKQQIGDELLVGNIEVLPGQ